MANSERGIRAVRTSLGRSEPTVTAGLTAGDLRRILADIPDGVRVVLLESDGTVAPLAGAQHSVLMPDVWAASGFRVATEEESNSETLGVDGDVETALVIV